MMVKGMGLTGKIHVQFLTQSQSLYEDFRVVPTFQPQLLRGLPMQEKHNFSKVHHLKEKQSTNRMNKYEMNH